VLAAGRIDPIDDLCPQTPLLLHEWIWPIGRSSFVDRILRDGPPVFTSARPRESGCQTS
jgi:hypothetical protein